MQYECHLGSNNKLRIASIANKTHYRLTPLLFEFQHRKGFIWYDCSSSIHCQTTFRPQQFAYEFSNSSFGSYRIRLFSSRTVLAFVSFFAADKSFNLYISVRLISEINSYRVPQFIPKYTPVHWFNFPSFLIRVAVINNKLTQNEKTNEDQKASLHHCMDRGSRIFPRSTKLPEKKICSKK